MTGHDRSLLDLSIREIGEGFHGKSWSPVEVIKAALDQIELTDSIIHAWVCVDAERALESAAKAESEIMAGTDLGPLHGVPIGVKDIFDVVGYPTRCGSAARDEAPDATDNAAPVARLLSGGAVVLGKTVTQEFAAGVVSPPARNPWDPTRIPGGSSGGSAAAVAARACFGAMGSDTGGSIRIPAAACGVTGFKPSYGQLDVDGVYPLSWSLDTVGPLARTVDDTWIMWGVLEAGRSRAAGIRPLTLDGQEQDIRIGVARPFFCEWLQPDVLAAIDDVIETLKTSGVSIVETPWRDAAAARACGFIINRVETAAVHERIAVDDLEQFSRYGADLRLRIAAGRTVPATLYLQAMRARGVVKDSMAQLFAEHRIDALLVPALPTTALRADHLVIDDTGLDESVGAGWTRLTMPFNATGQPVLAVPCGRDRHGLPVGLQLAGKPGDEHRLFQIGQVVEELLGFHRTSPPLLKSVADVKGAVEE